MIEVVRHTILPVNDAMKMLMFSFDQQLLKYILEVNVLLSRHLSHHHVFI
jgi:hypothetical protein